MNILYMMELLTKGISLYPDDALTVVCAEKIVYLYGKTSDGRVIETRQRIDGSLLYPFDIKELTVDDRLDLIRRVCTHFDNYDTARVLGIARSTVAKVRAIPQKVIRPTTR